MRCPDCCKFVGMENGDPEVNEINAEIDSGTVTITADVRGTRNCAECGTELKECCMDMEATVELEDIEEFKALDADASKRLLDALENGAAEIEVEDSGAEVDEAGGGRYAKNIITTKVNYTLTLELEDTDASKCVRVKHEGELVSDNAASEFDECC